MSLIAIKLTANLLSLPDIEFEPAFRDSVSNLLRCFINESGDVRTSIINTIERFFKLTKVLDDSRDGEIIQNIVAVLVGEFSKNWNRAESTELSKFFLEENVRILASLDSLTNTLTSITELKAEKITSAPIDTISVLLEGFEFCKNNSNSTTLNDQITQIFKTCYILLRDYIVFINKLQINCHFESEFNLLSKVLDKMYKIGTLVVLLDLKTMAELWKGYAELLITYSVHLHKEFNVSKIIRFLVSEIIERVISLHTSSDDKILTLTSKICVFLLKIIVKLCEYFQKCFGDCSTELFEFVLFLCKHSHCLREFSQLRVDLTSKMDMTLVPGVDPLLTILVNDRQFIEFYLSYSCHNQTNWGKAAFLLLASLMLRKLLVCSDETINMWINDTEQSVLHHTFKMIQDCDKELYYDTKISVPCSDACLSQDIYIYDSLLISFSSLIINEVSNEKFPIVEDLLMANLLNSSPFVGIFICDLWCILSRYGSPELCYDHVRFLATVSNGITEGSVKVLVRSLLKRLFAFLSLNHQLQIISELPADENFINCYNCIGTKFRAQIDQTAISDVANKYKNLQANLKQGFDAQSYTKMIRLINLFCALRPACWEDYTTSVVEFIAQTWKKLRTPLLNEIASTEFHSVFRSLPYLSRITCTLTLQLGSSQILDVLLSIRCLMKSESLRIRLCCLKILQSLQYYQIDSHLNEITNVLAECFSCGLISDDPVVKQFFLDGFTKFSHVTSYEVIVLSTTSKNKLVAEQVARYLKKSPTPVTGNQTFFHFMSILVNIVSKVKAVENIETLESDTDEVNVASSKRIKLHDDLDYQITQVEDLLLSIFQRVKNKQLNKRQTEAVVKILSDLEMWRGYL